MNRRLLGIIVGIASLMGLLAASRLTRDPDPAWHVAIVVDGSGSYPTPCSDGGAVLLGVLSGTPLVPGSTLMITKTGTWASALEPTAVPMTSPPFGNNGILEGQRRRQQVIAAYVAAFERGCTGWITSDVSPVYLAARRAIEQVRSQGRVNDHRTVYVISDLQETGLPDLRLALSRNSGSVSDRVTAIDNRQVDVVLCGYASTRGWLDTLGGQQRRGTPTRTAVSADRLIEVWRQLFTEADRTTMQPFCPQSTTGGAFGREASTR